jgi:hypothetical protein
VPRTIPTKDTREAQRSSSVVAELLDDPEYALSIPERSEPAIKEDGHGVYHGQIGRPSKYNPEFHCERVLEVMAEGVSKTELCLTLKIAPATLVGWARDHKEFAEAIEFGEVLCEAWWLSQGRENLKNCMFNNRLYSMHMCNRFGWTQRKDIRGAVAHLGQFEHHHTDGEKPEQIDQSKNRTAEVLDILFGAGAIESAAMQAVNPENDEIHPAQADA